jgi:hypothetical protein
VARDGTGLHENEVEELEYVDEGRGDKAWTFKRRIRQLSSLEL